MVDKKVDARGLSCPEPVLLVRQAIHSIHGGTIEVLVDTVTSQENVTRMAESLSWTVEVKALDEGTCVLLLKKVEHE